MLPYQVRMQEIRAEFVAKRAQRLQEALQNNICYSCEYQADKLFSVSNSQPIYCSECQMEHECREMDNVDYSD